MSEGVNPLNPIYIIKARRASDFIIYYFFFILFTGQQPDKLLFDICFYIYYNIKVKVYYFIVGDCLWKSEKQTKYLCRLPNLKDSGNI